MSLLYNNLRLLRCPYSIFSMLKYIQGFWWLRQVTVQNPRIWPDPDHVITNSTPDVSPIGKPPSRRSVRAGQRRTKAGNLAQYTGVRATVDGHIAIYCHSVM